MDCDLTVLNCDSDSDIGEKNTVFQTTLLFYLLLDRIYLKECGVYGLAYGCKSMMVGLET